MYCGNVICRYLDSVPVLFGFFLDLLLCLSYNPANNSRFSGLKEENCRKLKYDQLEMSGMRTFSEIWLKKNCKNSILAMKNVDPEPEPNFQKNCFFLSFTVKIRA